MWEGYCYLKVSGLKGLWAITRLYDGTDLARFVVEQIDAGEVGRVWDFEYPFSIFGYMTRQIVESDPEIPLPMSYLVRVIAIVREDNSALVRAAENGHFVEAMPFSIDKQHPTKANIPSIWHPNRKNIKQHRLAKLARLQSHPPLPVNELFTWKQGSLPEAVTLLETLYYCACGSKTQPSLNQIGFHWPLKRENLLFPGNLRPRMNMLPFLQIIWDHHHFDKSDWIPKATHYSKVENKYEFWARASDKQHLILRSDAYRSNHEHLESTMKLHDMFKGKISDAEIDQLLTDHG